MQVEAVGLEEAAAGDTEPVGAVLAALGEDADQGPVGVAARVPGPGLDLVGGDAVEVVDDLQVGEGVQARHRLRTVLAGV